MTATLQAPILLALLASAFTAAGLAAVASYRVFNMGRAQLFGIAAGGMLVTFCFLHLLPEAMAMSTAAPGWIMAGFVGGLLLNNGFRLLRRSDTVVTERGDAIMSVIAIALHSTVDGMIYSVTFAADFTAGLYTAMGLILHEFPEGVIAFALLKQGGFTTRNALILAFLAAGLTTPLGVLLAGPVLLVLPPNALALLFAASVGLLVYVATGPLLAPLRTVSPRLGLASAAAGVVVGLAIVAAPLGGTHAHDLEHGHEH